MEERFQFDREKFKNVIHHAVSHAILRYDPQSLGNTKLHKILYYSDMLRYLESGYPLTGADYQRQRFGPTARHLTRALKELEEERRVSVKRVNYHGYSKSEYEVLAPLDIGMLSAAETNLIEQMVEFVCARTTAEISDFSHDEAWSSVRIGERIPYYAAFAMFPAEITDADIEEATEEAIRIAPIIEAEQRNGHVH